MTTPNAETPPPPSNEPFDPTAQRGKMFGALGLDARGPKGPEIVTEPPSDPAKPTEVPPDDKKPALSSAEPPKKDDPKPPKPDEDSDDNEVDPIDEIEKPDDGDADPGEGDDVDPFSDEELEKMRQDDTHAIKTAKEEGKKRKTLEREKQTLEKRNVQLSRELEEARGEIEKFTAVRIDPTTHPDFIAAKKKTHNSIIAAIDNEIGSDAAEIFEKQGWGDELTAASRMIDATVAERRKIKEPLKLAISKKLGLVPRDTKEFDAVVDQDAVKAADQVIAIMSRHTAEYDKLAGIYGTIQTKAESKGIEVGHKEYTAQTKTVREKILSIGAMTAKDIEEDPDSLQAMAARKIRSSPEAKERFDGIVKAVIEMRFGPEALSQEELDRHVQAGKDMGEFQKNRERRVKDFSERRMPEIAAALVLWPEIKKALPDFLKAQRDQEARKDKKEVVRKTTGKPAPTKDEKPVVQNRDELREKMRKSLKL